MTASSDTASAAGNTRSNVDPAEVERFQRLSKAWWDPHGKFRPLHQVGPARLSFVRAELIAHFGLSSDTPTPLEGLRVIDIGCGGGLISEPLTRLGAKVTGIDPGSMNIDIARGHAAPQGLDIDYRVATVEEIAAKGEKFDAVVCLEVVEHVPDVRAFLGSCASLLSDNGVMVLSTLNRNLKSYALAIVAAEYVLGWLPRGTHQWDRFITPDELKDHVSAWGLTPKTLKGFTYNPIRDVWSLNDDTGVNYLLSATRRA